jgi:thermopsin
MSGHGRLLWILVAAIAATMVLPGTSALPLLHSSGGGVAAPAGGTVPAAPPSATHTPQTANSAGQRILAALAAAHAPMDKVFLPNFNALTRVSGGVVQPLYSVAPAPMGLGDFGIQEKNGANVGTISYSSSIKAAVTFNAVEPLYLGAAGPDQFTIQENTVLTHVDVLGDLNTDYWIQNVPVYYASTDTLVFEDNIWNFSNPSFVFPPNGIYAHGPASFFIGDEVYIGVGLVAYHVAPPFTITTYNNATVYNDRPTVFFNYTLSKGGASVSGSFDFAEFNSTGLAPPSGPPPQPTYQIDGQSVNPTGYLLNDAEVMIGGPGGGSTTTMLNIAGSFGLWTQPNGSKSYKTVPSAYDFGTDTGETSEGIAEYARGGANPIAVMSSGPSLLYPLWGVKGAVRSGVVQQNLRITPSNAFVFVSPGGQFNDNTAAWAPVPPSGHATYYLPPGKYSYHILLSDHAPVTLAIDGSNGLRPVNLPSNPSLGVYTPLWAFGNGQLAGISSAGTGTVADPYVLLNNQVGLIDPLFGEFNDFLFPVFPGIFLVDTSAYVSVVNAPSFLFQYAIQPEQATVVAQGLPTTNYLEQNYYGVSHVSLVNSPLISGWIFLDDVGFTEASVVFWNSSDNLIAGNVFQTMSQALMLFGGTGNVIWGNVFVPIAAPAPNPAAVGLYGFQFGLTLWESGDLIYNNEFLTPFTANTPTVNIYNGAPAAYADTWNVTMQPSTDQMVVNGWILAGNILGLGWEGGNYWADYGTPANPYGVLPYNASGAITVGGDYLPLLTFALYAITFTESGLPTGTPWSVMINGYTQTATGSAMTFYEPNGTYAFVVSPISGYTANPALGAVIVDGAAQSVAVSWK